MTAKLHLKTLMPRRLFVSLIMTRGEKAEKTFELIKTADKPLLAVWCTGSRGGWRVDVAIRHSKQQ